MPVVSVTDWDRFTSQNPATHLLQTAPWGELKSHFGWESAHLVNGRLGAQVLFRPLAFGLRTAYLPRGPVGLDALDHPDWAAFRSDLDRLCRTKHAIFVKIEPDAWQIHPEEGQSPGMPNRERASCPYFSETMIPEGFSLSPHSIQPARTLVVDLEGSEEALLGRMKQKTRYNIRLAQRHEVIVRPSHDIDLFYRLISLTGKRDRFGVHSLEYYRQCFDLFQPRGLCELLVAWYHEQPLAALMVFACGKRSWYLFGASDESHREIMPTYLLQWEAMRWARQQGCTSYDLWGVPDADEQALEANFMQRSHGLWGVYRFKRGFGGALLRSAGPWDRVYLPWLYRLYRIWIERKANP